MTFRRDDAVTICRRLVACVAAVALAGCLQPEGRGAGEGTGDPEVTTRPVTERSATGAHDGPAAQAAPAPETADPGPESASAGTETGTDTPIPAPDSAAEDPAAGPEGAAPSAQETATEGVDAPDEIVAGAVTTETAEPTSSNPDAQGGEPADAGGSAEAAPEGAEGDPDVTAALTRTNGAAGPAPAADEAVAGRDLVDGEPVIATPGEAAEGGDTGILGGLSLAQGLGLGGPLAEQDTSPGATDTTEAAVPAPAEDAPPPPPDLDPRLWAGPFDGPVSPGLEPAPEVFLAEAEVDWSGARTLRGIWIAHPAATGTARVRIIDPASGRAADGALFRRERMRADSPAQISSDAAEALGLRPERARRLIVVGLRRPVAAEAEDAPRVFLDLGDTPDGATPAGDTAETEADAEAAPPADETATAGAEGPAAGTAPGDEARTDTARARTSGDGRALGASSPPAEDTTPTAGSDDGTATVAREAAPEDQSKDTAADGDYRWEDTPESGSDEGTGTAAARREESVPAEAATAESAARAQEPSADGDTAETTPTDPPSQSESTDEAAPDGYRWAAEPATVRDENRAGGRTARATAPEAEATAPATEPAAGPAPAEPQPGTVGADAPPDPAAASPGSGSPPALDYIQAGIFAIEENASRLVETLTARGIPVRGEPLTRGGRQLTRVVAGPFGSAAERDTALRAIEDEGIRDARLTDG